MDFCEPHRERGALVRAARVVAETPMCLDCFSGRSISPEELIGEARADTGEACRRYYRANREKVLATHRRRRQAKRSTLCTASS